MYVCMYALSMDATDLHDKHEKFHLQTSFTHCQIETSGMMGTYLVGPIYG